MCGRFTFLFTWKQLHELLSLDMFPADAIAPRYNVAPSQSAAIVRCESTGGGVDLATGSRRVAVLARWGLVPSWADSLAVGNMMVNARAETLADKPAFRDAFAARRCVVPISGFYEWRANPRSRTGGVSPKQPFYVRRADDTPLLLAGLWERWTDRAVASAPVAVDSFTIITCAPNAFMAKLHDRMPSILSADDAERWLDPAAAPSDLSVLLRPAPEDVLAMHPVSTRVNSPKNEGPDLIVPRAEAEPGLFSSL
ncbi:MAG: SOS response-associated peptidase [Phycisphaerales bacterium]